MRLAGEPPSVPAARRLVAQRIAHLDPDVQETAVFLVSEVVTNAVLHARTAVTLRCVVEPGGVLVEVSDESPLVPLPRRHDADAVTGRGLEMVELLAAAFGVAPSTRGKTVWFSVGSLTTRMPTGWSTAPPSDTVRVRLMSVPVALYDVLQQHNEAVLREYELMLLGEGAPAAARRDVADAGRARAVIVDAIRTAAEAAGDAPRVDVLVHVPVVEMRGFTMLRSVLDAADAAAARLELLARPGLPELLELRSWLYAEVLRQVDGEEPQPWKGSSTYFDSPAARDVDVDVSWVARTVEPIVVGDDANRVIAVSPAAADLLGWAVEDLVGQRITVIVPPRLREDHITGFTRHLVSGQARLIGRTVEIPALRRDGTEVEVTLRLEREGVGSRTLFVATLVAVGR